MGKLTTLKTELDGDPLAKGYAAMTDQEAVDSLNAMSESEARSIVPAYEILEAIAPADIGGLSALDVSRFQLVLTGDVDMSGANTQGILNQLFDDTLGTQSRLAGLTGRPVSRAQQIGLPKVRIGHVIDARAL